MLLSVVAVLGFSFVSFDTSFQAFLEKDNSNLQSLIKIQEDFSSSENNAFIIIAPKSGQVFERKALEAIEIATEKSWHLHYIKNAISLANTPRLLVNEEGIEVVNYFDSENDSIASDLQTLKQEALNGQNIIGRMNSENEANAAIYLDFDIPQKEHAKSSQVLGAKIKAIGTEIENTRADDLY